VTANDVDRREAVRLAGRVREVSSPAPATWVVRLGDRTERRTEGGWLTLDVDGATAPAQTDTATPAPATGSPPRWPPRSPPRS
jgi:hypothetical protein